MFVACIPNRNSNPTWLLHQSTWKDGKSVKTTLANLTKGPHTLRMQFREVCRGGVVAHDAPATSDAEDIGRFDFQLNPEIGAMAGRNRDQAPSSVLKSA